MYFHKTGYNHLISHYLVYSEIIFDIKQQHTTTTIYLLFFNVGLKLLCRRHKHVQQRGSHMQSLGSQWEFYSGQKRPCPLVESSYSIATVSTKGCGLCVANFAAMVH